MVISGRAISLRKALDDWQDASIVWIERTLALGHEYLAARNECGGDDTRFGHWLVDNGCNDLGDNDRKALINLARHTQLARTVAQEDNEIKPRTLWGRVQDRIKLIEATSTSHWSREPQSEKTDTQASTTPLASVSDSPKVKQRHPIVGSADGAVKNIEKAELVKRLGITAEDYATLFGAYSKNRQIALRKEFINVLDKKSPKKRILALFQIGVAIVRANKAPELGGSLVFDARIFLPDVPEGICKWMTMSKLVEQVDRVELLNAKAVALKNANMSAAEIHEELMHFWTHGSERPKVERKITIDPADSKARIKHEVTFCGQVIWPHDAWDKVTYDDLNAGWHLVDYWVQRLEKAQPQKPNEVAVQVQHLIQDIAKASSIDGLTNVMLAMMSAYNKRNGRKDTADLTPKAPPGLAR
jgi:hypothetical protein